MYNASARKATERFIQNIRNGTFTKDFLTTSKNYNVNEDQVNLEAYKKFIRTLTYLDCIEKRKIFYVGD